MKYKCNTCEGAYFDVQQDGLLYFHACPYIEIEEGVFEERKDKRDENAGKKREGKGRTKID